MTVVTVGCTEEKAKNAFFSTKFYTLPLCGM